MSEPQQLTVEQQPALKSQPLTWTMLAHKMGVSVQAVFAWRKKSDAPTVPDLELWRAYIEAHKLGGGSRPGGNLRDEKTRHEIELLKAKIAREHRRVIDREEVNQLLLHLSTRARSMLYQFMETEAPPKLDGLPAATQRPILREMADSICDAMADAITEFEKT